MSEQQDGLMALSLWQPTATLLAAGTILTETRPWRPKRLGLLALHAGKSKDGREWSEQRHYRNALQKLGLTWEELPFGAVVGVAELWDLQHTDHWEPRAAHSDRLYIDFPSGLWAWRLRDAQLLPHPVPTPGRQSTWTLPPDVTEAVLGQLAPRLQRHPPTSVTQCSSALRRRERRL